MTRRVAFVVQRCGRDVAGGSERHCLEVARRLAERCDVEILTSCARDYMVWANHYPPGEARLEGVAVRRFPVARERDLARFGRLSEHLRARLGRTHRLTERRWMRAQGPWTPELFAYLRSHRRAYDAFFFFTYLYATSYFGLPLVQERAFLVPTAHDEWPIYLRIWDRFFERPRGFVFNTPEEQAFLRRRFPAARLEGSVVGVGAEPPPVAPDPALFRRALGIEGPFLLYVGRIDPSKGCDRLLAYYRRYRARRPHAPPLVLVGRAAMPLEREPGVVAAGFVDDTHKWSALAGCEALVMPSPYESLSIALLEAWTCGRPVLVTRESDVLVGQVRRAQGGLWYGCADEFALALDRLRDPATARILGGQGRRYVGAQYRWDRVVESYLELVEA